MSFILYIYIYKRFANDYNLREKKCWSIITIKYNNGFDLFFCIYSVKNPSSISNYFGDVRLGIEICLK